MDNIESYKIATLNLGSKNFKPTLANVSKRKVFKPLKLNKSIDLNGMIKDINKFSRTFSRNLSFSVDKRSGTPIIIVKESNTGKIIRQIPPKEMIRLTRKMKSISGIIFHQKA